MVPFYVRGNKTNMEHLQLDLLAVGRAVLEKFVKEKYRASTFNTCQHQLLLEMHGPPMEALFMHTLESNIK